MKLPQKATVLLLSAGIDAYLEDLCEKPTGGSTSTDAESYNKAYFEAYPRAQRNQPLRPGWRPESSVCNE
jgi:hypothetical protein